ncbi:MAG: phage terminase large subunit [Planctomycetia bacterium]|nr:phage terminase large subunit [Planctomycetia bacterium]
MKKRIQNFPDDICLSDVKIVLQTALKQLSDNNKKLKNDCKCLNEPLLDWAKKFLPNYFTLEPSEMHYWLANELDTATCKRNTKINLLAPRCSAKSTLGTLAYPLREAVENREHYIWIISDTKSQALCHLTNIAYELFNNQLLRNFYSFLNQSYAIHFSGNRIKISNGVVLESYGTGQRIRGLRFKENRPSLIICDDIQNEDHILSLNRRNRSRQWFYGTLMKAGNTRTNFLQLATALHQEAIAYELTKNQGWISKVFKSIINEPYRQDLWKIWESIFCDATLKNSSDEAYLYYCKNKNDMDLGASVLWKENENIYDLMRSRLESGEQTFLREKQNSPINYDLCEFSEKYFEHNIWCNALPKEFVVSALALDPSKGKEASYCDYTAFVYVVLGNDDIFYVDSNICKQQLSEMIEHSIQLLKKYNPDLFGIETNQFQELIKVELEKKLHENELYHIQPYPILNKTNKTFRIRRLEPYLSANKLRFLTKSKSNQLLIEQLKYFPLGDHDDGPDALEMAVRMIETFQEQSSFKDTLGTKININVV